MNKLAEALAIALVHIELVDRDDDGDLDADVSALESIIAELKQASASEKGLLADAFRLIGYPEHFEMLELDDDSDEET